MTGTLIFAAFAFLPSVDLPSVDVFVECLRFAAGPPRAPTLVDSLDILFAAKTPWAAPLNDTFDTRAVDRLDRGTRAAPPEAIDADFCSREGGTVRDDVLAPRDTFPADFLARVEDEDISTP